MTRYPAAGPVTLRTNLDDYPITAAIKSAQVASDLVDFDFAKVKVAADGFKPMVRDAAFDAGELAIITYLLARQYGKPYVMLPATVVGRFQHGFLAYDSARGIIGPKDLEGRRVGIRAYSVTTTVWVRAILQHDYGVDLAKVRWAACEDPHLTEFRDPSNLERIDLKGRSLDQALVEGEFDAAVLRAGTKYPSLKPVIPDPQAAARDWASRHPGAVHVNHLFVVHQDLCRERPDIVRELWRMLVASKAAMPRQDVDTLPFGLEAVRPSLDLAIAYALEQGVLTKRLTVDELFDDTTRALVP
jgi:4,5-dihydroxyphthalate decarboxylase